MSGMNVKSLKDAMRKLDPDKISSNDSKYRELIYSESY